MGNSKAMLLRIFLNLCALCIVNGHYSGLNYYACPPSILPARQTLIPHPVDCSKYLYCALGTLVEFNCPPGLNFDARRKICNVPAKAHCHYPHWSTTASTPTSTMSTTDSTGFDPYYCDSTNYYGDSGSFSSPNYPNPYPNNLDCNYYVYTDYLTVVILRITYDLESCCDYLRIYDNQGRAVTQLTGNASNYEIQLPTNYAQVSFHTDRSVQLRGFYVYYYSAPISTAADPTTETATTSDGGYTTPTYSCGSTSFSGNYGTISSPNYPDPYPNNADCNYIINTPYSTIITVRVNYDLESGWDYLRIYDNQGRTVAQLTGNASNYEIQLPTNYAQLNFHTDGSVQKSGFYLYYYSASSTVTTTYAPTTYEDTTTTTGSGGTTLAYSCGSTSFSGNYGTISSPNYPNPYPNNVDCTYYINTPSSTVVTVRVNYDLESNFDYVRIYNDQGRLMTQLTGNVSNYEIELPTNYARVYFHTDGSVQRTGFYLYYYSATIASSTVPTTYAPTTSAASTGTTPAYSCGSTSFSGSSGSISSPNYPNFYPNNVDCTYYINTPYSTRVSLRITYDFETCCDYLRIYDNQGRTLGNLAGNVSNYEVQLPTNYARVYFHTDSSVQRKGFYLYYYSVSTSTGSAAATANTT